MTRVRRVRAAFARLCLAAGLITTATALAGCGSTIASLPGIGQSEEAQRMRPEVAPETPNVYAPATDRKAMTAEERVRLQSELAAARDQAAATRREQINRR